MARDPAVKRVRVSQASSRASSRSATPRPNRTRAASRKIGNPIRVTTTIVELHEI